MVLIIQVKWKIFLEKEFPHETDPLGGDAGVSLAVMQRYVATFGIPYWGTRKMVKAYSIGTDQPIPVLAWTESMRHTADQMLPSVSGAWKNRIIGQTVLIALLGFILSLFFLARTNVSTQKMQESYRAEPRQGDLVLATEMSPGGVYPKEQEIWNLFVFKIEEIRGDSLIISRSLHKEDPMQEYRIKNKDKLIALFDGTDFTTQKEVYSLTKYREGDERLRRIKRKIDPSDRAARQRQDSILRHTDIIQPIYIKRR